MAEAGTKTIVCTLSPTAMPTRLAQIHSLTQRHLRSHLLEGSTLRLIYDIAASAELRLPVLANGSVCRNSRVLLLQELSSRT